MTVPAEPPTDQPEERSPSPQQDQPPSRPAPRVRNSTLVVTNLGKLISLGIAFHEMVIRQSARESVVAYCVIALVGAQTFEEIMMRAIDRIFGRG